MWYSWLSCLQLWHKAYPSGGSDRWLLVARDSKKLQGLSVPFACVGSSDPVRVLRLYTMNTLDTL